MDIQQTRLLSHTAKLTGARFRSVISERDQIIMPRKPADFADSLAEGRNVEIQMPRSHEWTRVTSTEQLRKLVETAWQTGYAATQPMLPPVATLLSDAGGKMRNLLLQCPDLHFARAVAPAWDPESVRCPGSVWMAATWSTTELPPLSARIHCAIPAGS